MPTASAAAGYNAFDVTVVVAPIPEPAAAALLTAGVAGLALLRLRRRAGR